MGGRSDGNFNLNKEGFAVFHGEVSLENNGGFSSLRYQFPEKDISGGSTWDGPQNIETYVVAEIFEKYTSQLYL